MADVELTVDMETAQALRNARKLGNSVDDVGNKTARLNKRFSNIGKYAKIGAIAAAGAVTTLGYAAKKSVESYADFQNEIARTNTISKLSGKELDNMKKNIVDLSVKTGISATEIASGLEKVYSAGFNGENAFKTLSASAKGASAGFVSLDDSVSGLISAMKTFDMTPMEAMDNAFFTKEKGIIQIDQYGKAISRIGNAAKAAGLDAHDFGAAMATLTKTGAPVEEATTQFKALLRVMGRQDFNKKIGKALGVGNFDIGTMGLKETIKSFRKLNADMNKFDFAALFPDDESLAGMRALLNNANGTAEELIGMKREVRGATLAAEKFAENPAKAIDRNLRKMDESFRQFGEAFSPTYMSIMTDFTSTLVENKEGLIQFGKFVADMAKYGAKGFGFFGESLGGAKDFFTGAYEAATRTGDYDPNVLMKMNNDARVKELRERREHPEKGVVEILNTWGANSENKKQTDELKKQTKALQ